MAKTDVAAWLQKLPYWEQLALDKILSGETITNTDIDELVHFLLEEEGLEREQVHVPLHHLGLILKTSTPEKDKRILTKLFNFKNVSSLVDGQIMPVSKNLTVFFGDNRSGKSTYVRFIADSAFCRATSEILPDIGKPYAEVFPTMDAEFSDGKDSKIVHFEYGQRTAGLSSFYVFNTESAMMHLTRRNQINFSPANLAYLTSLADLTDKVRVRLKEIIQNTTRPQSFHLAFHGSSTIATEVSCLNALTDLKALADLSLINDADRKRKDEIQIALAELRGKKVAQKIVEIGQIVDDFTQLQSDVQNTETAISNKALEEIDKITSDFITLDADAKKIGLDTLKTQNLVDVGGAEWKQMVIGARRFAAGQLSGDDYPRSGDYCLLCHQSLPPEAINVIQRVWQYLSSSSETKAKALHEQLHLRCTNLKELNMNFLDLTTNAGRHLNKIAPELFKTIQTFLDGCRLRRDTAAEQAERLTKIKVAPLNKNGVAELQKVIADLISEQQALKKMNSTDEIARLEKELTTLEHRITLERILPEIKKYVNKLKWADQASKVGGSTKHITDMHNEMFDELVTAQYVSAFEGILKALKRPLKVKIKQSGQKGEAFRKVVLDTDDSIDPEKVPAVKVLSDGEKRAVATADFLAEVLTDQTSSGVIFDDPVTSLDSHWKTAIADLLVNTSSPKQVIVFTHDLHFLYLITEAAKSKGIDSRVHWIKRGDEDDKPGYIFVDNSPASEKSSTNPAAVQQLHEKAITQSPQEQNATLQQAFGLLRTGYEGLFMFELLQSVVVRFRERVSLDNLQKVKWEQALVDEIHAANGRLSRYIDAHSHSDNGSSMPTVQTLKEEITKFIDIRAKIKTLHKK